MYPRLHRWRAWHRDDGAYLVPVTSEHALRSRPCSTHHRHGNILQINIKRHIVSVYFRDLQTAAGIKEGLLMTCGLSKAWTASSSVVQSRQLKNCKQLSVTERGENITKMWPTTT